MHQHSMLSPLIEWDNHNEEAEHLKLEISVPGRAMGRIHPSFFEVATWAHHLESAAGTRRYRLFVDAMVNRIRFEESNPMEILSFVNLVATDTDWKFLEVALTCIPELKKDRLHDQKHFQLALLFQQLKQRINKRSVQDLPRPKQPEVWSYEWGLKADEKEMIKDQMFGLNTAATGVVENESMRRIFPSTIGMMFPQLALNRSMGHARTRGTDIERDHQGLPFHMTMPAGHGHCNPVQRSSHKRVPSHGYFYTPGNTRLSTGPVWPGKPTGPSQEDSSSDSSASYYSAHEDSEADDNPPPGLLTQLEFDGIDDPRQTIPSKYRSSHGKLPKIRTSGEAEAFAARRAKSPSRPQVPDDAPPPYLKTQTDKDVYRAICHTAGPLILLDYFNSLPPLPPSLDQESHEGPVAAPSADNGVVPNEPVAQTEGGNFSFPPLLPVPDREIGDISKSTKLLADGAAPNEPVVQVGFGGFVREKVVLCPFQRSDNLRHPKDPYVTGHRSGKLVLL